jgi:hypothetical protein
MGEPEELTLQETLDLLEKKRREILNEIIVERDNALDEVRAAALECKSCQERKRLCRPAFRENIHADEQICAIRKRIQERINRRGLQLHS